MRHSQLRAFHHVALHGGFSRAAAALNQTQPALSDQVRKLEQAHDTLLFHRDHRQVRLTRVGEGLFRLTSQLFEMEQGIADYLGRSRAGVRGQLRILADSALHITAALRRFRADHADVFVSVQSGNTEDIITRLRNYEAEIGIVGNLDPGTDLCSHPLGRSPVIAIAAEGVLPAGQTRLVFDDLYRLPLVFRESGSHTRHLLEEEGKRRGRRLAPSIVVDGREAMREVVASGAGIGFVSEAEAGHDSRIMRVPIGDIDITMTETLVYLSARADVPVIRAFLRSLGA